ncbi:mitotic checkpoint serine/threonine-protein kinase BUB1 beta isoform X4 [Agelaius tricolor]|uniref:mitotic checkpoint serine/threonine-protein kinase BUB1 beta isoform X4 n=1 Tax=Agelaius tricolor TaxID=9191 RepID=UPI0039F23671
MLYFPQLLLEFANFPLSVSTHMAITNTHIACMYLTPNTALYFTGSIGEQRGSEAVELGSVFTQCRCQARRCPFDCGYQRPNPGRKRPRSTVSSGLEVPHPVPSFTPYVDESAQPQMICSTDCAHQKSACQPLAVRNPVDSLSAKESTAAAAGGCDELNGIERLSEDAIVTGSYKNKTLCANPEDTCDFNRAAHLASTPFHGVVAQRVPAPAFSQSELKEDSPESKSAPLNQETPVGEEAYTEVLSVKKLRIKGEAFRIGGEVVMSQEDSHEWELSKENVQPLRQGRVMSSLQEALSQQDSSSHTAVQLKKQEFEAEIRFYSGDDPLDVWERYIRWTEQAFPGGGKDGNLAAVLERAVQALHGQQRYYKDPRYLNLWLKFGDYCNEPLDLYSYLHSQEIGTTLAPLYITWAEALEARGSFRKADLIFQEGLQRKAEPLDKLQAHHKQFQARVSRQTLLALEDSPDGDNMGLLEIAEPQRSSLADLKGRGKKKVRAPISRVGDAVKVMNPNRSSQPQASLQLPNAPSFAVFDENSVSGPEIPTLTAQSWPAPPVPRAKENELSAGPWNSGRRPRSTVSSGLEVPHPVPSFTPYVDESAQPQMICTADRAHQKSARQPLAVRNPVDSLSAKESTAAAAGGCDELNGIERLSEDAIVTGSYKNKTLCANPEDTCDFNRAAHLASTPFHGVVAQRVPAPAFSQSELKEDSPESKSAPLNQETPVGEEAYTEVLSVKKLSPIMEASLEDTHSSGASVSGGSLSSVTQTSAIKYLQISEKLELAQSLPAEGVTDDDVAQFLWSPEQRKKLLGSVLSSLTASPDFHLEAGALPHMEAEKDIELGNETYCIKMEYWNDEEYKMFFAIPTGCIFQWDAKGFAIKVYSQPVPWDFYITLELQKRLNSDFDQSFSENCSCYLYQDGCAIVHKDINCFTLRDILRDRKFITKEIIFLVVHDLLHVVEKLHKAEIVHGDLRPEVFFLGDRICDAFSNEEVPNALKVVDFSHSLDLRVLPRVSLPYNFPTAQTPHGQQLLAESSLPYQVDLVGIADIVHLLLFGDHIQVYQENSIWKISQNLSKTPDSDFWSKLFERILNADGKSTVPLLRELREEISEMFDSSFKERLLLTLAAVGETFLLVNFQ